jgi:pimeloyl-ACP methyl ester carboxylesterase
LLESPEVYDIQAAIRKLAIPVLLVQGEADTTVPPTEAAALKAANPQAELVLLPGEGHTFGSAHPATDLEQLPAGFLAATEATLAFFS